MKHKIKKSKSQLRATIELLADSKYIEYVHYMITLFTHHPRMEKIGEKQKKTEHYAQSKRCDACQPRASSASATVEVAAPLLPETLETEKPAKGKGRMNTIPPESDESFLNELLIEKLHQTAPGIV